LRKSYRRKRLQSKRSGAPHVAATARRTYNPRFLPAEEAQLTDILAYARDVLSMEAQAIRNLVPTLGTPFEQAVRWLLECRGMAVVSGVGKSGLIGQKLSSTFASTGTTSLFLHPTEALHGDLGRVRRDDVALLLSQSGETEEIVRLIDPLKRIGARVVAMTGTADSTLGRNADAALECGRAPEACPLGLAPTSSTASQLALGDALAMTVQKLRGFQREDYARFHPGGALGRRLMTVGEIMRSGDQHTVVARGTPAKTVVMKMNATKGRPGAAAVVDERGSLAGFFTDGDLARHLDRDIAFLERPIDEVMNPSPIAIVPEALASAALQVLRDRHIDQIPVVDAARRPIGLVDVQDLLAARII
jgi:arabinose-5-phosphate isomerase